MGQVPEDLDHLGPQETDLATFTEAKLVGWVKVIALEHRPDVHGHQG